MTLSSQIGSFLQAVICVSGEYSMLLVSFHLQRHMGNFLIQVYGPCVLLVVLSWVSFWLNREATADRVSLGKQVPRSYQTVNVYIKILSLSFEILSLKLTLKDADFYSPSFVNSSITLNYVPTFLILNNLGFDKRQFPLLLLQTSEYNLVGKM